MLNFYRGVITVIDFFFVALFSWRTRIVLKIGEHKKKNHIAITDYEVEHKKRNQIRKWAGSKKLGKLFINCAEDILEKMINFSKEAQNKQKGNAEET